jgi:hypothetical protein
MSQLTICPIRLKTEEILPIIGKRKTTLRKAIKHKITFEGNNPTRRDLDAFGILDKNGNYIEVEEGQPATLSAGDFCPYKKGTVLWVKEKFLPGNPALTNDNSMYWTFVDGDQLFSDGQYAVSPLKPASSSSAQRAWKAENYLPIEAARIWLQVTDICVQRLNDITEEEAVLEGVGFTNYVFPSIKCSTAYVFPSIKCSTARESYMTLWDSMKGLGAWDKNPWVWVVSFNVLSVTGKPIHINAEKNGQVAINAD